MYEKPASGRANPDEPRRASTRAGPTAPWPPSPRTTSALPATAPLAAPRRRPGRLAIALLCLACAGCASQSEVLEREVGAFALKIGTAPTRSMAQGLVRPAAIGALRGGLDATHESGWYVGQWSPGVGLLAGSQAELNSYLGYARPPVDAAPGFELGVIRYSFPELPEWNRDEFYAGLNLPGGRLGGALSSAAGRSDSTLLLDLAWLEGFGLELQLKYANHRFETRQYHPGGHLRAFNDWSLNLSRPLLGMRLDLSWSDSSLDGGQCHLYSGQNPRCQGLWTLKAEGLLF